jgi:hypothetical protein
MSDYIYKSTLRNERNWTDSLIAKYLGSPDKVVKNPNYRATNAYLYSLERVKTVENSPDFIIEFSKLLAAKEERKKRARKALQTKIEKAITWASTVEIVLVRRDITDLIPEAIENYNFYNSEAIYSGRKKEIEWLDFESAFGCRILRNYLRHCCTEYESYIRKNFGKVGVDEAYDVIRSRIEEIINIVYPELKSDFSLGPKIKMNDETRFSKTTYPKRF